MTLDATVRWLARLQHRTGSWTDFLLAPGPSDSWITGYVGTALALAANSPMITPQARAVARNAADAAAMACLQVPPLRPKWAFNYHHSGQWGWTDGVRADADSTAWVVRLLALRGWPVPPSSLDFLASHRTSGGYRTYRSPSASGAWAAPAPEVTAAVLLARHAVGELDRGGLTREWCELLAPARGEDGAWHSMWWPDSAYPSAVVGAAWVAAGRPGFGGLDRTNLDRTNLDRTNLDRTNLDRTNSEERPSGWELAAGLWAAAAFEPDRCPELAAELLAARRRDGGWAGQAVLRVPPQRTSRAPLWTRDVRGIFTTATALHAVLASGLDPSESRHNAVPRRPKRSARRRYDQLVRDVATSAGADPTVALPVFRTLTRESLARPGVWPAAQLSNLAGGTPLEFSAGATPALRLTTEVGDPLLPPQPRVRSGLRAIGRAAALLGMATGWRAVQPAVAVLTDPELPVPDGCRFWVWAGLDLTGDGRTTLKAYVSLHAEDVPGWPARESSFLAACGVPADAQVHAVLDRLRQDGWCHEVGVGLAGGGAWGIKVYYELAGYRPSAVADVLAMCGLDADPTGLAPEVPGVLRASLAAKRRSGIAIRVHPGTGRVDEVTVAAAFPTPLVGRDAVASRVHAWLGCPEPHDATYAALLPSWREAQPQAPQQAKMHSLLTRTRSARGDETKVYLRPWMAHSQCDPT